MEKPVQNCIVCREDHETGIVINDQFICHSCEQEMVKTDVREEKYLFFIQQMKQIWLKKNA
ncbi:sigma factor G inhibitor Gin [Brevibacillus ginsengisoli]|uniref:sigma factor G inhibitor Gin n=1 Tax=Brevibacillus ginsengisoli TaxID=363854 RepID=UPI003CF10741